MSDRFDELARNFEDNVLRGQHSRSIGLFTIPEYPEFEGGHGMWSTALDILFTTLRYLGPATLLTLFWGQPSFIFKFLKYIDCTFRAIVFSNEEQKQTVLKWLTEVGPVEVEELDAVWQNGWVVCAVLDAALPGACAGHTPTQLSLKHAQSIAEHYLGVEPVFSRQELELNDSLSKHQEWRLAIYLDSIRKALAKLTPPVTRSISQRTSPDNTQYTFDYVARGSGLSAAQVKSKMHFKIYATAQQALDPGEITIIIKGPKNTYGMCMSPPVLGKAQLIRQNVLGLQTNANFTENALPITHGATYLRSYGRHNINKTYYIPKTKYDIDIDFVAREDHVRIGYVVQNEGNYEISITSRGQNIVGSPFTMKASTDILGILEKDNFSLEDGEEIDIHDIKTDKKVVLRIVDFGTEKMLLKDNGILEKISDDEANQLMTIEIAELEGSTENNSEKPDNLRKVLSIDTNKKQFKNIATKILILIRICKKFNHLVKERRKILKLEKILIDTLNRSRQQGIPDIVNSTFNETGTNPFLIKENREKLIIPENISVAIRTEKPSSEVEEGIDKNVINIEYSDLKLPKSYDIAEDYNLNNSLPSKNPFINKNNNHETEKDLACFVQTEYESNNFQTEGTDCKSMLQVEKYDELHHNSNPFIELDLINLERPKTPIYKIITDNVRDRDDSVYFNSIITAEQKCMNEENSNPFSIAENLETDNQEEKLAVTDFIIGAPVSLPPTISTSSPEPGISSMILTLNPNNDNDNNLELEEQTEMSEHNVLIAIGNDNFTAEQSSDLNETLNSAMLNDNLSESSQSEKHSTGRKELWDSAYVSIDDNASSPDTNNNENTLGELVTKHIYASKDEYYDLKTEEIANMGPAEREIWQFELNTECTRVSDDIKFNKWENKRSLFTPIVEETDKSLSLSMKESKNEQFEHDTDPVSVAFLEIDNIYQEYFPEPENSVSENLENNQYREKTYEIEITYVDSASDTNTDVKRHTIKQEGKISEVQTNATESDSVSQYLHDKIDETNYNYLDQFTKNTKFGDNNTNIVSEKKKYWDNRISEIEAARSEEIKAQKKRRSCSKHLRHNDSLTKRKGKKIIQNFLNAGGNHDLPQVIPINRLTSDWPKPERTDIKLVKNWKKFWDEKLDVESEDIGAMSLRSKSPKIREHLLPQQEILMSDTSAISTSKETIDTPVIKQELCEEVFKAFETSPKRFFGTSRKQILNKLDCYLGRPTVKDLKETTRENSLETGLVSSRISLFLNKSKSEELSLKTIKSKSMHNIYRRKDSDNGNSTLDIVISDTCNTIKKEMSDIEHNNFGLIDKSKDECRHKNTKSVKDKRSIFKDKMYNTKSVDETIHDQNENEKRLNHSYSKQELNKSRYSEINKHKLIIRKTSISKSEMDIFKKTKECVLEENLDKHKSYDGLSKVDVKSFINLYESATKIPETPKLVRKASKDSLASQTFTFSSSKLRAANQPVGHHLVKTVEHRSMPHIHSSRDRSTTPSKQYFKRHWERQNFENDNSQKIIETDTSIDSIDLEIMGVQDPSKETTYLSLSDIELEIIETKPEPEVPIPTHASNDTLHEEYKSRFKMAKDYFKSLEELREMKTLSPKLNECEMLLYKSSPEESPKRNRPQKRVKKSKSTPSSEISKILEQLQNKGDNSESSKLMKISEKFNVEDLFNDIMEGRLSRQGSLRGIPNKKAVLETFRSMENVSITKLNSYDISMSQLTDFAQENNIKNAQTYLTEYPYLPTTDPSKYHSRLDTKASGLVSMKELLEKRPRRNSVPDLRLITNFTVEF